MLTDDQHSNLMTVLGLIAEAEMYPTENTHDRLTERSRLPEESVAWAIEVLWNEGRGWLDFHEHPRLPVRAYYPNKAFHKSVGDLDDLHGAWLRRKQDEEKLMFDGDPDDPDDEWHPGVYEDE